MPNFTPVAMTKVVIFDFDGTLRDGLDEKIFAFQKAYEVTSRLLGQKPVRAFTEETMRTWAGVPVGEIAEAYWPEAKRDNSTFREVYEQAWDDVYNHYNKEMRDKDIGAIETKFTAKERYSILSDMPLSPWFPHTQDMIKDLDSKGVFVGILSNPPSISALKGEVATGGVLGNVKDVFTGSPFGIGKPHPDALLHGITLAWAQTHQELLANKLQKATDEVNLQEHKEAVESILELMTNNPSFRMNVLMVGDGAPDLKVATAARRVVAAVGLTSEITIASLGLGYGWQYPKVLAKHNPSGWAKTPQHMVEQINHWLSKDSFMDVPDYPAIKHPAAPRPANDR